MGMHPDPVGLTKLPHDTVHSSLRTSSVDELALSVHIMQQKTALACGSKTCASHIHMYDQMAAKLLAARGCC
jgi:hypothetical protein